jgi:hypothetical protein
VDGNKGLRNTTTKLIFCWGRGLNAGSPHYGVVTAQPRCFVMEKRPRAVLMRDVPISCDVCLTVKL